MIAKDEYEETRIAALKEIDDDFLAWLDEQMRERALAGASPFCTLTINRFSPPVTAWDKLHRCRSAHYVGRRRAVYLTCRALKDAGFDAEVRGEHIRGVLWIRISPLGSAEKVRQRIAEREERRKPRVISAPWWKFWAKEKSDG